MNSFFSHHPLNAITTLVGALTLATMAWRLWQGQRKTPTQFNGYFLKFAVTVSLAYAGFTGPLVFSSSSEAMRVSYLLGMVFLYLSCVYQSLILWYLTGRNHVLKWLFVGVTALLSVVTLILEYQSAHPVIRSGLVVWRITPAAARAQAIVLLFVLVPIGLFILGSSLKQSGIDKVKSASLGLVYLVAAGGQVGIDLFANGRESTASAVTNLVVYVIFFVALILPRKEALSVSAPVEIPAPPKVS